MSGKEIIRLHFHKNKEGKGAVTCSRTFLWSPCCCAWYLVAGPLLHDHLSDTPHCAGEYHCPSTFAIFNENSYIVAIKTTGNVFSHDAVKELCIKSKLWKDLVDDTPFTREDLITLQAPHTTCDDTICDIM